MPRVKPEALCIYYSQTAAFIQEILGSEHKFLVYVFESKSKLWASSDLHLNSFFYIYLFSNFFIL